VHKNFDPAIDFASFMSVPLVVKTDVIAVINLGSKKPGTYSSKDADLVSLVFSQMALAIERLELQRQKTELERQLSGLRSQLNQHQSVADSPVDSKSIREFIGRVNHDINNSLAILVGNVQCMQMEKEVVDQKTLSRLKRMERALLKISEANHKILQLIPSRNAKAITSEDSKSTEETITPNA
ncbi:MAG: GAF domain-containing protein, partial [candidate division Zixibacteria bacterium]